MTREMVLYLPASHPFAYDSADPRYSEALPFLSLKKLGSIDFLMPSEEMSYYDGITSLFQKAGFHPKIRFKSANVGFLYKMVQQGNGAAILPRELFSPRDPVVAFSLKPKFALYSTVAYKKGRALSPAQTYMKTLIGKQIAQTARQSE